MESKTVRDFQVDGDVTAIADAWASANNFKLRVVDPDGTRRYQRGQGLMVNAQHASLRQSGSDVHLEAWTHATLLDRIAVPGHDAGEHGGGRRRLPGKDSSEEGQGIGQQASGPTRPGAAPVGPKRPPNRGHITGSPGRVRRRTGGVSPRGRGAASRAGRAPPSRAALECSSRRRSRARGSRRGRRAASRVTRG